MRFLADECCSSGLIVGLRSDGHEVLSVGDFPAGVPDAEVLDRAFREDRILLTEDRDFGELVFRLQLPAYGVVYLRFPVSKRSQKLPRMRRLLSDATVRLPGSFVVLEPDRMRFRRL